MALLLIGESIRCGLASRQRGELLAIPFDVELLAVDHVISKVQAWSKMQSDDLTVLICDYQGAGA